MAILAIPATSSKAVTIFTMFEHGFSNLQLQYCYSGISQPEFMDTQGLEIFLKIVVR